MIQIKLAMLFQCRRKSIRGATPSMGVGRNSQLCAPMTNVGPGESQLKALKRRRNEGRKKRLIYGPLLLC